MPEPPDGDAVLGDDGAVTNSAVLACESHGWPPPAIGSPQRAALRVLPWARKYHLAVSRTSRLLTGFD